jgi:RimJ/RimL family protein N-acetyltransferase
MKRTVRPSPATGRPKLELRGEGVFLKPLQKSDGPGLFRFIHEPEVGRFMFLPQPYRRKDMAEFIARARKSARTGELLMFTIRRYDSDEPMGAVGIMRPKQHPLTADLGYWLGKPFWGQGIMTQAVKLALAFCFDTLKVHRVGVSYLEGNEGSRRVIEKCWFRREGLRREAMYRNKRFYNHVDYGLLEPEYRQAVGKVRRNV